VYWYVSTTKVAALQKAGRNPLRSVGVKLSAMGFAEAEVALSFDAAQERSLDRLRKRLDGEAEVRRAPELAAAPSTIFSFRGPASRSIVNDGYWVALVDESVAVLLVGSPTNAVSGLPPEAINFSPSADPVGAARRAFETTEGESGELGFALSYAWQHVMRQSASAGAILPTVHGLAVFAGLYPADNAQMRRGGADVTHLALGSPIYVEQS
jgi:hypothetical protein